MLDINELPVGTKVKVEITGTIVDSPVEDDKHAIKFEKPSGRGYISYKASKVVNSIEVIVEKIEPGDFFASFDYRDYPHVAFIGLALAGGYINLDPAERRFGLAGKVNEFNLDGLADRYVKISADEAANIIRIKENNAN